MALKRSMALTWTLESLAETVWALNKLLELVRENGSIPLSSTAGDQQNRVVEWLHTVEPMLSDQSQRGKLSGVPPFPLSGSELDSLEAEIHHLLSARAVQESGAKRERAIEAWRIAISLNTSLEHLHKTLQQAVRSSRFIIEGLTVLIFLNTICLILVLALRHYIALTANVVVIGLVVNLILLAAIAALWRLHHSHLQQHHEGLGGHLIHHRLL
jgi:hypothetical protein